jgi:hypothetical protein
MGMMDFFKKAAADPRTVEQRIQDRRDKAKQKADADRKERAKERAKKLAASQAVREAADKARKEKEAARPVAMTVSKPAPAATTAFVSDFVPVVHKKWHERPDLTMPYAGARQVSMDEVNRCSIGAKVRFNKENAEHYIGHGAFLFKLYVVLRNGGVWTPEVKAEEVPAVLKEMTADWKAKAPTLPPALGDLGNPYDVDSRSFDPTVQGGA